MNSDDYDEIGYWTENKLNIFREYASAYSRILHGQKRPALRHIYIDAFAGAGIHLSRTTSQLVAGSPLNALLVDPPFSEYHLIDVASRKVDSLREIVGERSDVTIHQGDCNDILLDEVFPRAKYKDFVRALCILDPYGLDLKWEVMQTAGRMGSIEILLNFPIQDMNRNVLRRDPENVDPRQAARMTAFWGDESWRQAAYDTTRNLFGWEQKTDNASLAEAFRKRLRTVAGFKYVPAPMAMRNTKGSVVYYLFFASQNAAGGDIVGDIFRKYQDRGNPNG
ncbi:MAG: three-Cys-motif partner protein TcmP [Dehalococcoidia bacterium]|nr:three-Cys-motif partner protein TcmP [Dehalococcoidia bacterium]